MGNCSGESIKNSNWWHQDQDRGLGVVALAPARTTRPREIRVNEYS
jgi:hypothetical protein